MSHISFLKKFLLSEQRISELSQVYHHIYFRDIEARCLAGNNLMFRCVGLSEEIAPNSFHYTDIIKDPAELAKVLKNDRIVLDNKETITLKMIANILNLSNRTIEFYMENIKSKFGVNKRSELLPLAFNLYPDLIKD